MRTLSSSEIQILRREPHYSQLFLYIDQPTTVLTAQVDGTPQSLDRVTGVTIKNIGGNASNVIAGMTGILGTAQGLDNLGRFRVRGINGNTLLVGETSDVKWQNNAYITILDDFEPWAVKLDFVDGLWNIEGEIAYSDQNQNFSPIPVLGPPLQILALDGATSVQVTRSASDSWCPDATIASFNWNAPGASIQNGNTANATLTYTQAGRYRIACTITASNGKSSTGYRYIVVVNSFEELIKDFELISLAGDVRNGGWSGQVKLYGDISNIRKHALCAVISDDYYGSEKVSLGPLEGFGKHLFVGRIGEIRLEINPQHSVANLTLEGLCESLKNIYAWPFSLLDKDTIPDSWLYVQRLTIDKAIAHYVIWRSTLAKLYDVLPTGDVRRAFDCSGNLGPIYDQLRSFVENKIKSPVLSDRFSRLVIKPNPQLQDMADRTSIEVMTITKNDLRAPAEVQEQLLPKIGLVEVAGFCYSNGWTAVLARSGNALSQTGEFKSEYSFLFTDQNQACKVAGHYYAWQNNRFPEVTLNMAGNYNVFDITRDAWVRLDGLATTRGNILSNVRGLINRVDVSRDAKNGITYIDINVEIETSGVPGVPVVPPSQGSTIPNIPAISVPKIPSYPLIPPKSKWWPGVINPIFPTPSDCTTGSYATGPYALRFNRSIITTEAEGEKAAEAPLIAKIRPGYQAYSSYISMIVKLERKAGGLWIPNASIWMINVDALDEFDNIVASGITSLFEAYPGPPYYRMLVSFDPPSAVEVKKIRVRYTDDIIYDVGSGRFNLTFNFAYGNFGFRKFDYVAPPANGDLGSGLAEGPYPRSPYPSRCGTTIFKPRRIQPDGNYPMMGIYLPFGNASFDNSSQLEVSYTTTEGGSWVARAGFSWRAAEPIGFQFVGNDFSHDVGYHVDVINGGSNPAPINVIIFWYGDWNSNLLWETPAWLTKGYLHQIKFINIQLNYSDYRMQILSAEVYNVCSV